MWKLALSHVALLVQLTWLRVFRSAAAAQAAREGSTMTWKDKLEIGLKDDAPYRKDNLPDQQVRGPEIPAGEGRSPIVPAAAGDVNKIGQAHGRPKRIRKKFVPPPES
jgi:hypothetical protein